MTTPPSDIETRTVVVGPEPHHGDRIACPGCGETTGTHLDRVQVAARHEDRDPTHISVHAVTGETHVGTEEPVPAGIRVGEGRRHRIAVEGSCQHCPTRFALVLTQHKGVIYVEWATQ